MVLNRDINIDKYVTDISKYLLSLSLIEETIACREIGIVFNE